MLERLHCAARVCFWSCMYEGELGLDDGDCEGLRLNSLIG